ncbi:MAG: DNA translocase FtsK 4TM domain-containing protein [bacterium]
MGRHRKYSKRNYSYNPPSIDLHPEAKKGILVIFLLAAGAISILSFFNIAGEFGRLLDNALALVFGSLRLVFGIAIIILAALVYLNRGLKILTYAGLILFFAGLGGLVHLIAYYKTDLIAASELGQGGGYVGLILSYPLLQFVGFPGAVLICVALLLISLVIIFNTSIDVAVKILKFLIIGIPKLIYQLIMSFKNKNFSPFAKQEIKDSGDGEDNEKKNEDEKGDEGDEEEPNNNFSKKEVAPQAALPLKRRRIKIEVPLTLLTKKIDKPMAGDIKNNIAIIQKTLGNFKIDVEMGAYSVGPTVTQYTMKPAAGVKLSKITGLSNDLALALAAHPIRIEAPIPGKALVGIEMPNQSVAIVYLRDILSSPEFRQRKTNLIISLGLDVAGKSWVADLGKMPHLLVAGSTGSGKSVCLNSIILSLLYSNGPDDLKLILVDPKRVEFPIFNGTPHLLTPVITDTKKTINSLKWAIGEMERRFDILSKANKRDIGSYNAYSCEPLPYIIIIIDELADLMASAGAEIEACIIRLAQMSRAVGIHLIVATQRPSVDVITGLIKANITSRIAFSVGSLVDSRTILDTSGAEKLLGRGDMLFSTAELSKPKRLQCAFVTEDDIKRVVNFLKENYEKPAYDNEIVEKQKIQLGSGIAVDVDDADPLLEDATETILFAGKASASLLQRRLSIGYARAARLLDILEEQGVIGPADGAKPRDVLMKKNDFAKKQYAAALPPADDINEPPEPEKDPAEFDETDETEENENE